MKSKGLENFSASRPAQRGASLLIVLLLLLIVTLLGLAILRTTLLEERMTANMLDRSLSFQAAESALREGEALAQTSPVPPGAGCDALGVCSTPNAALADRWLDPGFTDWVVATDDLGPLPAPAAYFVEFMGLAPTWPGCDRAIPVPDLCLSPRFRVTARSTAPDRANVMLQSNFIVR
jgi:type IV pilus assembly protein PilX